MISVNEFETIETNSGLQLRVRHLRASDAPFLIQIFDNMGSDSRYRRFNQPVDNFSDERKWQEAERIARISPRLSGGVIAFADLPDKQNVAVAAARYVCTGDGIAEAAMSVIDTLQKQGIGTKLMLQLVEIARQEGVKQLMADIRNDNEGILKILQRLPYELVRQRDGAFTRVVIDLTKPRSAINLAPSQII